MFAPLVVLLSIRRLFVRSRSLAAPVFDLDVPGILTQATTIFNSFSPVLVLAIGLAIGVSLIRRVKNMF